MSSKQINNITYIIIFNISWVQDCEVHRKNLDRTEGGNLRLVSKDKPFLSLKLF